MNVFDIFDTLSLIITIVGFAITIYNVTKARRLSMQIRSDLKRIDSIAQFSSAISSMEEIKALHRIQAWDILPSKYSTLRKALVIIREINPDIKEESKKIIQSTIAILSGTENEIERAICHNTPPPDIPKLNQEISKRMDKLHPILIEIQNKIGR